MFILAISTTAGSSVSAWLWVKYGCADVTVRAGLGSGLGFYILRSAHPFACLLSGHLLVDCVRISGPGKGTTELNWYH